MLCMSHQTIIRLVDQMGVDHDSKVCEWRDEILKTMTQPTSVSVLHKIQHVIKSCMLSGCFKLIIQMCMSDMVINNTFFVFFTTLCTI